MPKKKSSSRKKKPRRILRVKKKPVRKPAKRTKIARRSKPKLRKTLKKKQKKPVVKSLVAVKKNLPMPVREQEIGKVLHYFTHIRVGVVELTGTLCVGDTIHIRGHTTDTVQTVESMQIDHEQVPEAKAGQSIGLKVKSHLRKHDVVYKIMN